MQFIPSTWAIVGVDADNDGQPQPAGHLRRLARLGGLPLLRHRRPVDRRRPARVGLPLQPQPALRRRWCWRSSAPTSPATSPPCPTARPTPGSPSARRRARAAAPHHQGTRSPRPPPARGTDPTPETPTVGSDRPGRPGRPADHRSTTGPSGGPSAGPTGGLPTLLPTSLPTSCSRPASSPACSPRRRPIAQCLAEGLVDNPLDPHDAFDQVRLRPHPLTPGGVGRRTAQRASRRAASAAQ